VAQLIVSLSLSEQRLIEKLENAKEWKDSAEGEYEAGNVEGAKKKTLDFK